MEPPLKHFIWWKKQVYDGEFPRGWSWKIKWWPPCWPIEVRRNWRCIKTIHEFTKYQSKSQSALIEVELDISETSIYGIFSEHLGFQTISSSFVNVAEFNIRMTLSKSKKIQNCVYNTVTSDAFSTISKFNSSSSYSIIISKLALVSPFYRFLH